MTEVIINSDSERGSLHPGKAFCQIFIHSKAVANILNELKFTFIGKTKYLKFQNMIRDFPFKGTRLKLRYGSSVGTTWLSAQTLLNFSGCSLSPRKYINRSV